MGECEGLEDIFEERYFGKAVVIDPPVGHRENMLEGVGTNALIVGIDEGEATRVFSPVGGEESGYEYFLRVAGVPFFEVLIFGSGYVAGVRVDESETAGDDASVVFEIFERLGKVVGTTLLKYGIECDVGYGKSAGFEGVEVSVFGSAADGIFEYFGVGFVECFVECQIYFKISEGFEVGGDIDSLCKLLLERRIE